MKKLLILTVLLSFRFLLAQTFITSDITTNTNWTVTGSPYIIDDTLITVTSSATLSIDPGVEVQLADSNTLLVEGRLLALGTPTDTIRIKGTGH